MTIEKRLELLWRELDVVVEHLGLYLPANFQMSGATTLGDMGNRNFLQMAPNVITTLSHSNFDCFALQGCNLVWRCVGAALTSS